MLQNPSLSFSYLDITVMYMFWMAIKCFWIEIEIEGHIQPPCTALTAGNLPAVRAVQGDCEESNGLMKTFLYWIRSHKSYKLPPYLYPPCRELLLWVHGTGSTNYRGSRGSVACYPYNLPTWSMPAGSQRPSETQTASGLGHGWIITSMSNSGM